MQILTVSGSLRASSSNAALMEAAATLAPAGTELHLYQGLGDLPHFNPDLDNDDTVPQTVLHWRALLRQSAGVIFSVPEYAHGVPGVVKNALDWVVGSGEFVGKPFTLFNASPRGTYAQASLTETLTVMSSKFVPEAALTLPPSSGKPPSASQLAADPPLSAIIAAALASFARACPTDIGTPIDS